MNRRSVLVILVLLLVMTTRVDAKEQEQTFNAHALGTHDTVIDAWSWKSFSVSCSEGDTLSGEFKLKKDGELYPGDQTEYDNWLLTGIDFLILDETNYDLWIGEITAVPIFEMKTLVQLTWSIEIPHEGLWFVVYFNDSIFMKQIEGSITRSGPNDAWFLFIGIIGVGSLLTISFIFWKKK